MDILKSISVPAAVAALPLLGLPALPVSGTGIEPGQGRYPAIEAQAQASLEAAVLAVSEHYQDPKLVCHEWWYFVDADAPVSGEVSSVTYGETFIRLNGQSYFDVVLPLTLQQGDTSMALTVSASCMTQKWAAEPGNESAYAEDAVPAFESWGFSRELNLGAEY